VIKISNKLQATSDRSGFAPILLIILAAVLAVGGIGIGLAWKTNVLDKWLPANVKEFLGKEITLTNGEQPATDGEQPAGEDQQPTVEDQTKDWKSYASQELKITFKHPVNWYITRKSSWPPGTSSAPIDERTLWITSYDFVNTQPKEGPGAYLPQVPEGEILLTLILAYSDKPLEEDFRSWAGRVYGVSSVREGTVKLGNLSWITVDGEDIPTLLTSYQNRVYSLWNSSRPGDSKARWEEIDLIFSTLKFLE